MKVTKFLSAKFPTVQYGGVDIHMSVELSDDDLPQSGAGLTLDQKSDYMNQWANHILLSEWTKLRNEIETNYASKLVEILPPQVRQQIKAR